MRKEILQFLMRRSGRDVFSLFTEYKRREFLSLEENLSWQKMKLEKLILHAWRFVPYYRKIFIESGLVDDYGFHFEKFGSLPILSKDLIRQNFNDLQSLDIVKEKRRTFLNTSGGSTGEPLKLIQDNDVWATKMASKWFFSSFVADFPSKQVKLWGSERDILEGGMGFGARVRDFLLQRKFLNSFLMSENTMEKYVKTINEFQPELIEAYVQSVDELARFVTTRKIKIHSPRGIITSAGTLYDDVRKNIETAFNTKVYNRYGSREVGDMAFSCSICQGMHLNVFNHYFEILDKDFLPVGSGEIGKVFVTTLDNYSMPLIRYEIGDLAIAGDDSPCSCGRGMSLVAGVRGREVEFFKTKGGKLVDGEFFTHLFYFRDWVHKFQIIQLNFSEIVIRVVLNTVYFADKEKGEIEAAIKLVMGDDCVIGWEFPEEISSLQSGKYLYTLSKI